MPTGDYNGIEGFAIDAKNAQDCYEVIDRMHTQLLDEIDAKEAFIKRHQEDYRAPFVRRVEVAKEKIERLKTTQRILETAMDSLLTLEQTK